MKQIFTLALTFLLIFSLVTVTAFAADATITEAGKSATKAVKASYRSGAGGSTVYSVDITWGSMEFTYSEGPSPTWDPETHTSGQGGTGVQLPPSPGERAHPEDSGIFIGRAVWFRPIPLPQPILAEILLWITPHPAII